MAPLLTVLWPHIERWQPAREEFLIILPQADAEGAHAFAGRLRLRVAEPPVACAGGTLHLTIRLGIALFDAAEQSRQRWIERSDHAVPGQARRPQPRRVAADLTWFPKN